MNNLLSPQQFFILATLQNGSKTRKEIQAIARSKDIYLSDNSFYNLTSRMIAKGWIITWKVDNYSIYKINWNNPHNGGLQLKESIAFYKPLIDSILSSKTGLHYDPKRR